MSDEILHKVRADVEALLGRSLADLDAKALYALIRDAVQAETQARDASHAARSTLLLNGLLAAEQTMWLKVFRWPRKPVVAA